jgi:SAM-dependent methyltransferase
MTSQSVIDQKLACPVCLAPLPFSQQLSWLECGGCANRFAVMSGLPILLIDDENRRIKADEIKGEVEFNVKKIPPEAHHARNAFVDKNTEAFLGAVDVSLCGKEVLAVGCSMAELFMYCRNGARTIGLDIVPKLTQAYFQTTTQCGIDAGWVCGDGECLPFLEASFDVVMVRQALHHMLKYYSAISEFFRVVRVGGLVLIVDEPFCPAGPSDAVLDYPPDYNLYDGITVSDVRNLFGLPCSVGKLPPSPDFASLEQKRDYIAVDGLDPERLLADKYHTFSLLNCIAAIGLHTDAYGLHWSKDLAWMEEMDGVMAFRHGPSSVYDQPLISRLTAGTNVSIAAKKTKPTTVYRNRSGIRPLELDAVCGMLA